MDKSNAVAFRRKVQEFMARWHYTPSSFGRRAIGNPNFVQRIVAGANVSLKTVDRVETWMREQEAQHKKGLDPAWQPSARRNPIYWTPLMDRKLRQGRRHGQSWPKIAKELGVSVNSARRRHELITGIPLPKMYIGEATTAPHQEGNE